MKWQDLSIMNTLKKEVLKSFSRIHNLASNGFIQNRKDAIFVKTVKTVTFSDAQCYIFYWSQPRSTSFQCNFIKLQL